MAFEHEIESGNIKITGEIELSRTEHNEERVTSIAVDRLTIKVEVDLGPLGECEISGSLTDMQLELCRLRLIEDYAKQNHMTGWVA